MKVTALMDEPPPAPRRPERARPGSRAKVVIAAVITIAIALAFHQLCRRWTEERARREVVARIETFAAQIRSTDLADDAACRAALARIDAEREKWHGFSTENEIVVWRTKIQAAVDARARPR